MLTKTEIEKYFMAEKSATLIFLIIGIIAIVLSLIFFFALKTNFYKGAAIPLLLLGLIQGIVGYTVYSRSDQQRIDMVYAYDLNPVKLKNEELPRMRKINKNWNIYKLFEVALLVTGIILIILYRQNVGKQLFYGMGITLCIEALLMFGADMMAEKRAKQYGGKLEVFVESFK